IIKILIVIKQPVTCNTLPDATLPRLIMPTSLCLNGRPDKAFTPHPAIVHRCLIYHPLII
ncbi:hypothetical protein, partial [Escherichia coli]|uniref:hypothetical protein n=1 Tax=Escherichia coli TaxID=562 RepID=UPI001F4BA7D9